MVCPPTPALPDSERRSEYAGIVAQTGPFNVGFQLYGDGTDYGNWLAVWVSGVLKTAVTDYTVTSPSGPLANLCRPITDARVTFVAAQTGTIEIVGARRPRRASQVSENAGVTARAFNQVVSDMEAQLRESWDFTARTIRTPPGEVLTVLPPAATRANGFLKFDSSGLIPQIIAGGAGSGTVQGPLTTTVGDMAIWNINNGTLLADAPLNWAPLGGASGNGSFNFTSPGGMALTSTDTTTLGNSVQLGGTLRNGDTIALTLNYNNAVGTARAVTISYGPITGADTLTTIAAGLATSLANAGLVAPLSTDFAPYRFFIPGTVGNVGSLFKFNFAWLAGNNGQPTLNVVNASTAGTPTTISMNGTPLAVGAGVINAIATWDQVNGISALRNYTGGRGGLANDALFYLIVGSNSSNPATQLQYANIGFAIGDPAPATPYGVIQLATGNSWNGQANVWIGKGMFISNFGNSLTPTYPGAVANNRTTVADPGTGSLSMQGWTIPGNAITGTWPANNAYAFWGNSNLAHTDVTKYAIAQDTGANTLINGATLGFRINNNLNASLAYAGGAAPSILGIGIAGTSPGQIQLFNATSGSIVLQTPAGALGSAVLTLPDVVDQLTANAAVQTLTNKTINASNNTVTIAPSQLTPNAVARAKAQTFTASGTYTPSTGTLYAVIECWGGGGGGGGATTTGTGSGAAGGGGGGGYSRVYVTAAQIGASQTVTIGAAGTAGTAGGNGGNGGSTTVGALCGAVGGSGGIGVSLTGASNGQGAGGAGGSAGTGDIIGTGGHGFTGMQFGTTFQAIAGAGANTAIGGGGNVPGTATSQAGQAASGFASGGSGGAEFSGGATANGGAGAAGLAVITEYVNQ